MYPMMYGVALGFFIGFLGLVELIYHTICHGRAQFWAGQRRTFSQANWCCHRHSSALMCHGMSRNGHLGKHPENSCPQPQIFQKRLGHIDATQFLHLLSCVRCIPCIQQKSSNLSRQWRQCCLETSSHAGCCEAW